MVIIDFVWRHRANIHLAFIIATIQTFGVQENCNEVTRYYLYGLVYNFVCSVIFDTKRYSMYRPAILNRAT